MSSLEMLSNELTDKEFNLNDITYDKNTHVLKIPYDKERDNSSQVKKQGLLRKERTLIAVKAYLILKTIESYDLHDTAKIGRYSFSDFKVLDNKLHISCEPGLVIIVSPAEAKIELRSTDEVIGERVVSYFGPIEYSRRKNDKLNN